ncbi:extracellular solute-binding protein [Spiroplasma ixodetis]|uniref:extracellular solute-binding protein n=1 Tax=Spiroplasma ixodetis TaxID=2141 RepID=UPI0025792333|nr:extracellular solute-binding protein [Spiroplasma ixodetis]WJG70267.1 spermidine/putrescine ABC transporter permease [Spiroplasma ixodetis Y32]
MRSFFKNSYLAIIFLLFYTPILVLMIFSFNGGDSVRSWNSWSLQPYYDLFQQSGLWESVSVTLIVAFISTFVAVIIGTFAALGLSKTKKITRNITLGITNIPLVNADIVTAVSLMLLFMAFGFSFGLGTLIFAHISFNIPYVIITVLPKIRSINMSQLEASQDLGATPWYTLRKIVLPTIKPAIIAGAAIAFAMSFDDFLISYFTGGNTSNVSTFIYSLKRIKPYINAFSTIIILLIAVLIISWNTYVLCKKQIRQRNEKIDKGIYHDKKIIKTEKLLTKYYLQLNGFNYKKVKSKGRKRKSLYSDGNFEIVTEQDIIKIQDYIKNHPKLINQISKLEAKLEMESIWIEHIKNKIKKKKELKEERSKSRREKYRFLLWPWKLIMISIILLSSFISLGAFYIYTNVYDLSIANWGEYMNPNILKEFENKYQVKIKYSTFDDNESLYAKLYTTSYDVMVPSDYMVAKLASEDRLFPIASKNSAGDIEYDSRIDFNLKKDINHDLYELMNNYRVENSDGILNEFGLNSYSIPYFWGDVVLVINTTNTNNLSDLGIKADGSNVQWNVLTDAAKLGKRIVLNDDMHNLFMTALTDLHYKNKWGENNGSGQYSQVGNDFHDNINAHSPIEIKDASDWLEPVIKNKNTKLLNDDIVDEISNENKWDVAMMYNGDLLSAIADDPESYNGKYLVVRPYMGTNVWNDDMVISKNSPHKDLAFKFINYIMQKQTQVDLSSEFGYTSPLQAAMDEVSTNFSAEIWKHVYIPKNGQLPDPLDPNKHHEGYFNGLYTHSFDPQMQTAYNRLLAR